MSDHNLIPRLRKLRTARRLSQAALSEQLGFASGWVAKIESGERGIRVEDIGRWAKACGMHVEIQFTPLPPEQRSTAYTAFEAETLQQLDLATTEMSPKGRKMLWEDVNSTVDTWRAADEAYRTQETSRIDRIRKFFGFGQASEE